ncbi:hypothetical protein AB0D10_32095 [Kitasatospora sp. NPDC048545]
MLAGLPALRRYLPPRDGGRADSGQRESGDGAHTQRVHATWRAYLDATLT